MPTKDKYMQMNYIFEAWRGIGLGRSKFYEKMATQIITLFKL